MNRPPSKLIEVFVAGAYYAITLGPVLILLYVSAYLAMVSLPADDETGVPGDEFDRPTYRILGELGKMIFEPIHELDRLIDPETWHGESGRMVPTKKRRPLTAFRTGRVPLGLFERAYGPASCRCCTVR